MTAFIALECKPDEVLAKALGYSRKRIVHQPSNSEVINYLRKNPGGIGLIDEDRGSIKPPYFHKFQRETQEKFGIESFSIPTLNTRLVVIKPRLEEWILQCASSSEIKPHEYSFPDSGHALHKIINPRLGQLEKMIKALLERRNPSLLHLRELINRK
jgi:hypothetical protein